MAQRRRDPEWWSDMSGARKYAFIQAQVLFWGLFGVAAYLVFTNLGLAAGLNAVASKRGGAPLSPEGGARD